MAEAWEHYDECGELNAVIESTANLMSRVNIIAALRPEREGDEPKPVDLDEHPELKRHVELIAAIGGGPSRHGMLMRDINLQLGVVGIGYIYAKATKADEYEPWVVLSNDEARQNSTAGAIEVCGEDGSWTPLADHDLLIKMWDHHPRKRSDSRSQVRANLRTLRRIAAIDARFIADAESRLAGNGLLIMPMEVEFPPGQPGLQGFEPAAGGNEFIQGFLHAAEAAYADRSSPAARVPLVAQVPGEHVKEIQHIKFASDLSASLDDQRNNALRTLAVGLDVPPEQMLGMGDVNHWTGWLLSEQGITMHIEPRAARVCGDLNEEYFKAACRAEKIDENVVMVWYDTSDLETRPDLTGTSMETHDRRLIADRTLLGLVGLDAGQYLDPLGADTKDEFKRRTLLDVAKGAPTLAPAMLMLAGVITPEEAAAAAAFMNQGQQPVDPSGPAQPAPGAPAAPANSPPPPDNSADGADGGPDAAAASAVLAAADAIVERALERAGAKLRNAAASRGRQTIAAGPDVDMHTRVSATELASLDSLLAGAWAKVPAVADRYHWGAESLQVCLDAYTRALLASQLPHSFDRLAAALGVDVDARQLVSA